MPIQAAANKLKHEIETYGCPPVFPGISCILCFIWIEDKPKEDTAESTKETAVGEFHGKKTKLVAKTGGSSVHQWTILEKQGIPAEEIPKFVVKCIDYDWWIGSWTLASFLPSSWYARFKEVRSLLWLP